MPSSSPEPGPVRTHAWHLRAAAAKLCRACSIGTAFSPPIREPGPIARALYEGTRALPIVSPHGHCDPAALADDTPFEKPATELVTKDHYLLRMLYSQGVPLEELGVQPLDGSPAEADGRRIWRELAAHYPLFRGTPSKLWLDHTLEVVLGVEVPLRADSADAVYDEISTRLQEPEFRPRALYDRFGIAFLATTEGALDLLEPHALASSVRLERTRRAHVSPR